MDDPAGGKGLVVSEVGTGQVVQHIARPVWSVLGAGGAAENSRDIRIFARGMCHVLHEDHGNR